MYISTQEGCGHKDSGTIKMRTVRAEVDGAIGDGTPNVVRNAHRKIVPVDEGDWYDKWHSVKCRSLNGNEGVYHHSYPDFQIRSKSTLPDWPEARQFPPPGRIKVPLW
jgi:hypothetical protein